MDIKGILDKISSDARDSASKTLSDAQKKADESHKACESKLDAQREAMLKRVETDTTEMTERMKRMAELESKKTLLALKRGVMDECFDHALRLLIAMPKQEKRTFFLQQLTKTSEGNEQLRIGNEASDWFDASFLSDANKQLTANNKQGAVSLDDQKTDGCGFRLVKSGSEIDCTFAALIRENRFQLESEVAKDLFEK